MAYNVTNIGRPIKLVIGTPSLTVRDITGWSFSDGKSIEFKSSGNSTYDRHYLSKFSYTIEIKTHDASLAFGTLSKGATVENVEFYAESVYVGDADGTVNTIGLQSEKQLGIQFSYGIVEESGSISGDAEGGPAEYTIRIRAVRKPDGTSPTVSIGVSSYGES